LPEFLEIRDDADTVFIKIPSHIYHKKSPAERSSVVDGRWWTYGWGPEARL